jgi:adenine-specific DNA-methyltransferase
MSDEPTDDIQSVPSTTPDFQTELARQLQQLAPEAVADGKIDVKKLQELLDSDTTDDSERFGLFWPGKKRAMRAAQEPTTATLKPAKDESKDWGTTENIFIEGDNLETLKILQKYYHNKIKMIYTDPPYNTGHDFVYPDNFKEGLQNYLEFSKQVDEGGKKISTNSDTEGRYHSNWINMMYPRLKLARNLLTDDGIIFISIDDNELSNLRKICDEIFGEDNFVDCLVWKKRYGGGAKEKHFVTLHEYVLVYARSIGQIGEITTPLTEESISRYYTQQDANFEVRGPFRTHPLEATKSMGDRPNLIFSISAPDGSDILPKRQWLWSRETVADAIENNELHFMKTASGWNVHTKQYLKDRDGKMRVGKMQSVIDDVFSQHGTNEIIELFGNAQIFSFPKPTSLIMKMLAATTNDNDIVLDFFSGSATTAHAVMKINALDGGSRRHIQVQLPEPTDEKSEPYKQGYKNIAEISKERIKRAAKNIEEEFQEKLKQRESPLDTGFKTFKLTDSNFTKWQTNSDTDKDNLQQHLLNIRESSNDAASEEELLTEVLLKQGISLTVKLRHEDTTGLSIWNVGDTTVLAYLNEHVKPTLDQLRQVAAAEPAKIIILEDAFKGDDELKTNLAQICKTNKIELWTV